MSQDILEPVSDENDLYNLKKSTKVIPCICPRCNIKHKRRLFWTGIGIPKRYCNSCEDIVANIAANMNVSCYRTASTSKIPAYS